MKKILLQFTKMPTRFIKRLAVLNLSSYETRVFFHVLALTLTWHNEETELSITQEAEHIGLKRQHFHRALKSLEARFIFLTRTTAKGERTYSINPETQQWLHRVSVQGALDFEDKDKEAAS